MVRAGVGVGPGAVGRAKGLDEGLDGVGSLDEGVLLGEGAVGGGHLLGTGHLNGRGEAGEAVDGDAADLQRAGSAVEVDVDARQRHERLVAGRDERELLDLRGKTEEGAEGRVLEVELGDLVHDGAKRLGGAGEELLLPRAQDQRGSGPRKGAATVGGVCGREIGVGLGKALVIGGKAAHGLVELGLKGGEEVSHSSSNMLRNRQIGER